MMLSISFRPCKVEGGFISVAYNGTPNQCRENFDIKNVADAQESLVQTVKAAMEKLPVGTFYVCYNHVGRKVRGYDSWTQQTKYIEIKEKV